MAGRQRRGVSKRRPAGGRDEWDRTLLDEFAFAVVALRLRPSDYWAMSRGEYLACVQMWKKINGIESNEDKEIDQERVDSFSSYIKSTFNSEVKTNPTNG